LWEVGGPLQATTLKLELMLTVPLSRFLIIRAIGLR